MSQFSGYTGHLFEEKVLGRCRAIHRDYLPFRQAADLVRQNQPPVKAPVAVRLERQVSEMLGSTVKFYTAVRSTLDERHKVDAFFELSGVMVTIDLTMNPHKDSGKADLIVTAEEIENLAALAGRIAREMQSRVARRAA
jgi:hypothetical protein